MCRWFVARFSDRSICFWKWSSCGIDYSFLTPPVAAQATNKKFQTATEFGRSFLLTSRNLRGFLQITKWYWNVLRTVPIICDPTCKIYFISLPSVIDVTKCIDTLFYSKIFPDAFTIECRMKRPFKKYNVWSLLPITIFELSPLTPPLQIEGVIYGKIWPIRITNWQVRGFCQKTTI